MTGSGSGLGAATARMIIAGGGKAVLADLNKESGDAPIGATCARLMVTLIHALRSRGLKRGIASLCLGGDGGGNRGRLIVTKAGVGWASRGRSNLRILT